MATNNRPLEERIDLMGAKMTLRSPFISAVWCNMPKHVEDAPYGSAATNGEWIRFNRAFCDPLDEEQLLGLGLHETCHTVLGHIWRSDGYDRGLANVAQDAVINRMILNMGFKLPPKGVMFDWVTDDMDWEEVYRRLKQEQQKQPKGGAGSGKGKKRQGNDKGQGQGQGEPGDGNPMGLAPREGPGHDEFGQGGFDGTGDCDPCPSEARRSEIEATILTAAKMARECGDRSVLIDRVIGKVNEPTVRWQDELRAMMISQNRDDYSLRRPSRRLLNQGLYVATLFSESLGGLMIGWDMSGSMSDDDAQKIASELNGIVGDCNPDWVEVVYFDSKLGRQQRFERGDALELKPNGGGGTAFKPPFDYFAKVMETERVAGIIFFTDMCSNDLMDLDEPECPVIFGNVNGGMDTKIPFGHMVRVAT